MNFVKKTLIAAAIAGLGSQVGASQFYLNTAGTGLGLAPAYDATVCATCSSLKDELTIQYDSSTTITLGNMMLDVGDAIVTTGGLNVGGTFDADNYPSNQVTSFDPGTKSAGFIPDSSFWGGGAFGLSFSMNLIGTVAGVAPGNIVTEVAYSGGQVDVFAVVLDADGIVDADGSLVYDVFHLFDLSVVGSDFSNGSNFLVFGDVSFSGNEAAAFNDFFNIAGASCGGSESFYDLAQCMPPVEIDWILDQNLNNAQATIAGDGLTANITGDHDGSVAFNVVPVPAPLFLMGGALLGLAGMSRRKLA